MRKRITRKSDPLPRGNLGARHLFSARVHLTFWACRRRQALFPAAMLLLRFGFSAAGGAELPWQEPKQEKQESEKDKRKKAKPEPFVLTGTVFTEQGFSLAGAEIRIRRAGEKKVRGRARSDRRGEFGVRVPVGVEYEVTVEAPGYEPQTRKVVAQLGAQSSLVFRMQPVRGKKQ